MRRVGGRLRRPALAAAVLYLLAALVLSPHVLDHLRGHAYERGTGDTGLMQWWLAWIPHAIAHGHNPLVSDRLMAPVGVSAVENTSLALPAVLLSPVTETAGPATSQLLLIWLAAPLTALASYAWLRRHVEPAAAFVGGLVIGFNPFMTISLWSHPFMTLLPLVPLLLVVLERILAREGRWAVDGALLGVGFAAQVLTGAEVAVILVVTVVVAVVLLGAQRPRLVLPAARAAVRPVLLAGVVAVVLLAYPLTLQSGRWHIVGAVQGVDVHEARPVDLWARPAGLLGRSLPGPVSHGDYLSTGGYLLPLVLALALAAVLLRRHLVARTALGTAAVFVVLSWGGHAHDLHGHEVPLPWYAVEKALPVLQNVLSVRFAVAVWFCLGLVVALLVQRLRDVGPATRTAGALAVLAGLVLLVPRQDAAPAPLTTTPAFFTSGLPGVPAGALLLVAPDPHAQNDVAMQWQVDSGFRFRMPSGYMLHPAEVTHTPSFQTESRAAALFQIGAPRPGDAAIAVARTDLARRGVCALVVGPSADLAGQLALAARIEGRGPDVVTGGVSLWYVGCRPPPP